LYIFLTRLKAGKIL